MTEAEATPPAAKRTRAAAKTAPAAAKTAAPAEAPAAREEPAAAAPKAATQQRTEVRDTQGAAKAKLEEWIDEQSKKLVIDEAALNEEFKNQASCFLAAAARANRAAQIRQLVKLEAESVESAAAQRIRAEAASKADKLTEGAIKEKLALDDTVKEVSRKLIFAEFQLAQYSSVEKAWQQKKDMLIQLGSTARAEFNAGVSLRDGPTPARAAAAEDDDDEPATSQRPARGRTQGSTVKRNRSNVAAMDADELD